MKQYLLQVKGMPTIKFLSLDCARKYAASLGTNNYSIIEQEQEQEQVIANDYFDKWLESIKASDMPKDMNSFKRRIK